MLKAKLLELENVLESAQREAQLQLRDMENSMRLEVEKAWSGVGYVFFVYLMICNRARLTIIESSLYYCYCYGYC